jgi:LysR family cyn operon transcriptional activator
MVELHQARLVMLPAEFSTRLLLDECFEAAGATPVVAVELNSIAPMIELIRHTDLAGIIAENAVPKSDDIRVLPLEDPTPVRTPGLLWKRGATRAPSVKQFAQIIRRASGRED